MKVKQLIELLQQVDGEMDVVTEAVIHDECGFLDVSGTDTILLLDECGKSNRGVVIKTWREYRDSA
jgi:hypothetical protein